MKNHKRSRVCIYCGSEKASQEFSLEHIIPRCLGGAYAPDRYKTHDVCSRCNHNLGLFVDAAFEKSFFVTSALSLMAHEAMDKGGQEGLPLIPVAQTSLRPPYMREDEICECWLGPSGELVFWVRPRDESLFWYIGGNPRTTKEIETRAYYMLTEKSQKDFSTTWKAFRDSFPGRWVRKVMCTRTDGVDFSKIGFSEMDPVDKERVDYLFASTEKGRQAKQSFTLHTRFDHRFLAKLGLGLGYCLFGQKLLDSDYGQQLRTALWRRDGDPEAGFIASTALGDHQNNWMRDFFGLPEAITIAIIAIPEAVIAHLAIGPRLSWSVACATHDSVSPEEFRDLSDGRVIILSPHTKRGFEVSVPEFIARRLPSRSLPT